MSERKAKLQRKNIPDSNKQPIRDIGVTGTTGSEDVINEVRINVKSPVPLELENIYGFSPGGNKYIPYLTNYDDEMYGWDTFFNVLLETRLQSSTLDSVIDNKVDFTIGDGVYMKTTKVGETPDPKWTAFIQSCNSHGESLNVVLRDIIANYYTFGNGPIEFVKGTTGGKKWLHVYSKNQLDCRKSWPNGFNESEAMIISRWFRKRGVMNLTQKMNIKLPFYRMGAGNKADMWMEDTTDNQGKKIGKGVFRTALWLRNKYPGYDHYGLPSWIASLINADLEYAGAVYNHDNLQNGMHVGGLLTVDGTLAESEQRKLAKKLRDTFAGKGHGSRSMVVASTDNINKTDWKPFDTHKDGSFINLDRLSIQKIISANKWDGAFIGITDGMSKSKTGAYMNELYQQKVKQVIKPIHRILKESFFEPLVEIANEWLGTKWDASMIDIQVSNLFADTTDAATTVNGQIALQNIIKLVGSGVLPHDNAIAMIVDGWGKSEDVARKFVDGIKVVEPQQQTKQVRETE